MKTSHQRFEINEIYSQDRERARLSAERCTQRDPLFLQGRHHVMTFKQSYLTIAILVCPVDSTKKNEAVLLQSHSFFQKNQISSQLPDQISYLGMPSTFPIPKRKNFDPTPLLKWLQNRYLFLSWSTPRIYNQFLECGREQAFHQHSLRLAIPKTTTPSHRMEDKECSFLYSPSQNGALSVSGQYQQGMLNNSAFNVQLTRVQIVQGIKISQKFNTS